MNGLGKTSGLCGCGSGLRAARCCALAAGALPSEAAFRPLLPALDAALRAAAPDGPEAEAALLAVLELDPRHPAALRALYERRAAGGPASAAQALLERFVAHHPNEPWGRRELALRCLRGGEPGRALEQARSAVRLTPASHEAHEVLGLALVEANRPRAAAAHFERALTLRGTRDPNLLVRLAWAMNRQGRLAEARTLFEEADAAARLAAQSLINWALTEEADRDYDRAATLLDRAAALEPDHAVLRTTRASLLQRAGDHAAALAVLDLTPAVADVLLARGRALDRLGRHSEAFDAFTKGKATALEAGKRAYLEAEAAEFATRMKGFFTATRLRTLPRAPVRSDQPQPIFVLGFPRSGTTMVEQILGTHPAITAADELPLIGEMMEALPRSFGSPLSYPEALSELWMGDMPDGLELLRDHYLRGARLLGAADGGTPYFTDKMPLNEAHLGLIGLVFPASPAVHVLRHPCDVVLSVFSHLMSHGANCASTLESAARHYALVSELVAHYRAEMALRYLVLRYEDVVAEPEASVRRLLDFVGVEFDARCLDFQETRRHPRTPSHAQVAEKLYDRSRYRWRNYRRQLEPVLPILEPAVRRLGYTLD